MPTASPETKLQEAATCRELMRGGSKTFFAASLLLPARVRGPARALYAFCRLADDEIDEGADSRAAVVGLQRRLDDIYEGQPQALGVDAALAAVVHRHQMPRELLDALIEGFFWDTTARSYETLQDVQDYGARVAGTVGAMMAVIMGVRGEAAMARACDLGVAMQLTNIARDVGEDARNARLYLPRQWLREAGVDVHAWMQAPVFCARIASVVQRLLQAADALYAKADHGIAELPRDCRPAIHAARLVYAEIGREIERLGFNSVAHRAMVSKQRKLALLARASGAAVLAPAAPRRSLPVLHAVQFLVDAASVTAPVDGANSRSFDERMGWVIGLTERQALQQQSAAR
jgi:phytoene synthase